MRKFIELLDRTVMCTKNRFFGEQYNEIYHGFGYYTVGENYSYNM